MKTFKVVYEDDSYSLIRGNKIYSDEERYYISSDEKVVWKFTKERVKCISPTEKVNA